MFSYEKPHNSLYVAACTASSSASDCLEKLVFQMTCYVSSVTVIYSSPACTGLQGNFL